MRFMYSGAALPVSALPFREIDLAAGRLAEKLTDIKLGGLGISDYNQRCLGDSLRVLVDALQAYSYLLAWALACTKTPLEKCVLVDHGGGIGVLSLLAKELGVGTVIYNDIYDVSCADASLLGKAITAEADAYVCGEIDVLLNFLQQHSTSVDAIVSNNVIEHIYDLEGFLRALRFFPYTQLSTVFASSANIHNPRVRSHTTKMHLEAEYNDRTKAWGHKERDSLRSYLSIRREIIAAADPSLPAEVIEKLARETRGLRHDDIVKSVDEFRRIGSISYQVDHPTNTCDPYTGNWYERLINTETIRDILVSEGFNVQILGGYYGYSARLPKRIIRGGLNRLTSAFKSKGLLWAPYYVIYAQRKATDEKGD